MNISFERAVIDDADILVALQVAAFHYDARLYPGVALGGPEGYDSPSVMREKIEQDETYKILLNGEIIGGFVIFDRGGGHYHLDIIFIAPEYHTRGIGTQAMQFMERTYPAAKWTLDTPDWAVRNRHFYEKLGYVKVGETVHPDITLIAYEKHLV